MQAIKKGLLLVFVILFISGTVGVAVYLWQDLRVDDAVEDAEKSKEEEYTVEIEELKAELVKCRDEKDVLSFEIMGRQRDSNEPLEIEAEDTTKVDLMLESVSKVNDSIKSSCVQAGKLIKSPTELSYGGGKICMADGAIEWPDLGDFNYEYYNISSDIDKEVWSFSVFNADQEIEVIKCDQGGCTKV